MSNSLGTRLAVYTMGIAALLLVLIGCPTGVSRPIGTSGGGGGSVTPPVNNDTDGDGILNSADSCIDGVTSWTSDTTTDADGDGCRDRFILATIEVNDHSTLASGGDAFDLDASDYFGYSLAYLGDLDAGGAGVHTLAIGAVGDDTGSNSVYANRGALYLVNLNDNNDILAVTKIAHGTTIGSGAAATALSIANEDNFGSSVAALGDLDGTGDGVLTLAVGASGDSTGGTGRGAVYLFNLSTNGSIVSSVKIDNVSSLTGQDDGGAITLTNYDSFGASVAALGDRDGTGDGVLTLAVGASADDTGGPNRGAVYLLNLNTGGAIISSSTIAHGTTIGSDDTLALGHNSRFGSSLAALGTLNGSLTLAVGASRDDAGGSDRGSVHLLNLNANGAITSASNITHGTVAGDTTLSVGNNNRFGTSVGSFGNLDGHGDGVRVLAVGAINDSAGGASVGAVHLLNLNANGAALGATRIDYDSSLIGGTSGSALDLGASDEFGGAVAMLADPDDTSASTVALAVGASYDNMNGSRKGAVHLLQVSIVEDWTTTNR